MSKPWIRFIKTAWPGKTQRWNVENLGGIVLGNVHWWGAWRQYAFFANDGTLFEPKCLREIANFCEAETRKYRGTMPRLTAEEKA